MLYTSLCTNTLINVSICQISDVKQKIWRDLSLLALRVTLRLQEDKTNTNQSFWWMLVLYEWRSMDKTQYMNDVQHGTG
jgi:hypothetical protein